MSTQTLFLNRPEGRIAYDVAGEGPLVVLVPGLGDLRATYRFLAPALVAGGYRVATTDLRGHGESTTGFTSYGDDETGRDVLALVEHLGGPAVVVGNSMGAGAAAWAAAERPDLVAGVVLVGPFVRDTGSGWQKLLIRVAMARPWAAAAWRAYLPKLYAGRPAADQDAYLADVAAAMRRPGHAAAFARLIGQLDHAVVERRLGEVSAPALVVMGELDPDFPDPRAEAEWIAARLAAEVVLVPESGHYPQSQRPDVVSPAVLGFLERVSRRA
ncbi:MAG: alpha/beta fold hydrolase [Frankiales bacterium]|nr:alpha/beta fold hydrolase [Frankiales bacterium]